MPEILIYLLKVNIALLLFCLGYYLVLKRLTFYTLNRVYLITAIIFSSVYPAIDLTGLMQRHEKLVEPIQIIVINLNNQASLLAKPIAQTNYWEWLVVIFWIGVTLMAIRLAIQFISLLKIYRRSKPASLHNYSVRVINEEANPFSFWQSIYINPQQHGAEELRSIIAHEQVHVSQWHTLDILLAELSLVFYWFNPGVWLMKKAVAENLEFITDRKILQLGIDAKSYQYSLLYASFNTSHNAMVNHFNISTIKKRIMMMNSKKSSAYSLTRYSFIAPAVLVLLLAFGSSRAAFMKIQIKKVNVITNKAMATIGLTISPQKAADILPTNIENRHVILQKPAMQLLNMAYNVDTIAQRMPINTDTPKILLSKTLGGDSALYLINGKPVSKNELAKLNTSNISSIYILKDASAVNLFGKTASNGAVLIINKNGENMAEVKELLQKVKQSYNTTNGGQQINKISINGTARFEAGGVSSGYNTPASTNQKLSAYSIPQQIIAVVGSAHKFNSTKGDSIKEIRVNAYPAKGKINGINITPRPDSLLKEISVIGYATRNDTTKKVISIRLNGSVKPGMEKILFIVDGEPVETNEVPNINPNNIERIEVLKDKSATTLYGEKAKNGVILIKTKQGIKANKKAY
ncbi:TonB-dependent receptor plug domain-containing protein [Mucilaginibacter terrae]|uniref:M56 family metallopeptidase n=1 Tax=Mucilaginibacter terrae TaxID=1955052 RepID=UPI003628E9FF